MSARTATPFHSNRRPSRRRAKAPDDRCFFAPVPNRAYYDQRLKPLDHRVLGIIAMHDRMGKNGLGCTLTTQAIAKRLRSSQPNVSVACKRLVEFGYISVAPHPQRPRKRMRNVIYDAAADYAVLTSGATPSVTGSPSPSTPAHNIAQDAFSYRGEYTEENPLKAGEEIARQRQ